MRTRTTIALLCSFAAPMSAQWGTPFPSRSYQYQNTLMAAPVTYTPVVPSLYTMPPAVVSLAPNGLATTPPMGWNSWYTFQENVTEAEVKAIADAFVSNHLDDVGYTYVNLDVWKGSRNAQNELQGNAINFPSGLPALATYIHGQGLKAGIYLTVAGCVGGTAPSSLGLEVQDASWLARAGFDYVKLDGMQCGGFGAGAYGPAGSIYGDNLVARYVYQNTALALRATGRPIVYSICGVWGYGGSAWFDDAGGNLTRTANDTVYPGVPTFADVLTQLDAQIGLAGGASVGHWNDPDMLTIGNGLSDEEGRAQMSLWSILSAPLIVSTDLRSATAPTITTLTNTDVIAVDQDPNGITGVQVSSVACGGALCQVWTKQLTGTNTCASVLLNRDTAAHDITAVFATIAAAIPGCGAGPYTTTRDLWAHSSLGTLTTSYTATAVPAHGVAMIKVAP